MNKIRTVIIDDEYFNRELIAMLISKSRPDFELCGTASSVREGLKIISEVRPDVVFLDIKMPDGTGFDLLRNAGEIYFEVIFVTGFDNYALQAFDFNALDYVLKPIDIDKFRYTLERVEQRVIGQKRSKPLLQLNNFSETGIAVSRVPVKHKGGLIFIRINDIISISETTAGTMITTRGAIYTAEKSLTEMEFIFDKAAGFLRIAEDVYINA
ncbi:MAG TPA: response regulator, partial [Chitinophagaceae bacterium]|nr:response regulator [Chitinophagaceae bacterium]